MRSLRSKGNKAAFSLFAFQDILTTTIGIVLLIMLLLVLEISKADATTDIGAQAENTKPISAMQLTEDISLHTKILSILSNQSPEEAIEWIENQIQKEQAATEQLIEDILTTIASNEIDPNLDAIIAIHTDIHKVSKTIEQLKSEIVSTLLHSDAAGKLEELKSKRQQLQFQLDGIIANDSLVYIKQDDPNHMPFLVEISSNSITIHGNGVIPGMTDIRLTQSSASVRCDIAVSIIKQISDDTLYPLILVRPGGGTTCQIIREELQSLHISSGVDLLFDDQTTVPTRTIPEGVK